jgi:hypothetical protein
MPRGLVRTDEKQGEQMIFLLEISEILKAFHWLFKG